MRIIRFFLKFTVIMMVLAVSVFLLAREALLLSASHTLKGSLSELVLISNRGSYASSCRAKGITDYVGSSHPVLQLRFISDTEYVLEVNCVENSVEPVLLMQKTLPPFVQKKQGGSGFTLEQQRSAVELVAFQEIEDLIDSWLFFDADFIARSVSITAEAGEVIDASTPFDYENGPITSCSGYGYFCCDAVSQKGVGDSITGLTGCAGSCYSHWVSRPLVLSFTTSPFFEFTTRTLAIRKGEAVEFSYVSDPGSGNTVRVTIDFGDGESEVLQTETGTAVHTYRCAAANCEYTATVRLVDNWGVESSPTEVSKVTIRVQ